MCEVVDGLPNLEGLDNEAIDVDERFGVGHVLGASSNLIVQVRVGEGPSDPVAEGAGVGAVPIESGEMVVGDWGSFTNERGGESDTRVHDTRKTSKTRKASASHWKGGMQ